MTRHEALAGAAAWNAAQPGAPTPGAASGMAPGAGRSAVQDPMPPGEASLLPSHAGGARVRRVALISDHASPLAAPGGVDCGGQNVYVAHLACELARSGVAVDIFTRRDAPEQPHIVQWRDGVRVIHVPAGPPRHVPKEAMLPHMGVFARSVTRFARRQPAMYDMVHANFFMSGMVALHLKRVLGLPFVITFHALGRVRRLAQGAADGFPAERMRIEAALMREADRIIAECPQDRLDMERLYSAAPRRIAIAPCGFSSSEFWPVPMPEARRRLDIDPARFVVLQLGRMVPRKGIDTVIQGVAMLRQRHGVDASLVVVGGDSRDHRNHRGQHGQHGQRSVPGGAIGHPGQGGAELARLRQLARELGVAQHVRFAGRQPRDALRDYYAAADVFASTPWYEPFGITPVEAMACARPVIGAEVGGIKSTVLDGVTGYLIPSRDPEALAERLARLHRQPLLSEAMGAAGRARACEHYTWQRVAQQVMTQYQEVVDASRGTGLAPGNDSSDDTRAAVAKGDAACDITCNTGGDASSNASSDAAGDAADNPIRPNPGPAFLPNQEHA